MTKIDNLVFQIPDVPKSELSISGDGHRKIVVVTYDLEYTSDELITMQRLMNAIQYDLEKDAITICLKQNQKISLASYITTYDYLLMFGVKPETIGIFIEYRLYDIVHFEQSTLLVSDSVKKLNEDKNLKGILWKRLQKIFNVA